MSAPHRPDRAAAIHRAAAAPLLVVVGGDRGPVVAKDGRRGHVGATDMFRLLGDSVPFDEFHLGKSLRGLPWIPDLTPYGRVLNLITDADQNPKSLDNLRKLLRGYRGTVLNRPEAVGRSTRDQIAKLLAGTPGLRVPRVLRLRNSRLGGAADAVERAGLAFPVILRRAGTHTGNIVGRFDDMAELRSTPPLEGELIATEFVDYHSADGLYRKYRIYWFGQRQIFRHMLISDRWNIHVSERNRFMNHQPALIEEEQRLLARPEGDFPPAAHATFQAIRERLPLDFFGIDFGFDGDGRVILFEANATMSFFPIVTDPRSAYLQCILAPAEEAFRAMVAGPKEHIRESA